jgi:hypothetical protein
VDLNKFTPLFHLNHYVHEDWGQVHVFCEATKLRLAEVCFLSPEETEERCKAGRERNKHVKKEPNT